MRQDALETPQASPPPGRARFEPGTLLRNRYLIRALLGRGGMGEVYRADDRLLGRAVAVKVLRDPVGSDPEAEGRFLREARAAASLSHPNIVSVHDIGMEGETPFIVMELVAGHPLSDLIAERGRLDSGQAVEIAEALAEALAEAHDRGIVHRDVKPGNVMVSPSGWVKVFDFGIAQALSRTTTDDGRLHGTAEYLSPEQAMGRPVDIRSDVYSLGVVLFEMLTGDPPFTADAPAALARLIIEEPAPLGRLAETVPGLKEVVARCLQKDPGARYANARQVARDLRRLRSDRRGLTAVLPSPRSTDPMGPVPDPEPVAARARRGRARTVLAWLGGTALAAAIAAAVLWIALRDAPPARTAPPAAPPVLSAPIGIRATASCDGFFSSRVSLAWTPSVEAEVDGYAVYRSQSPGGPFLKVDLLSGRTAASYVSRELTTATRYVFALRPTSGSRLGPFSEAVEVRTPAVCLF